MCGRCGKRPVEYTRGMPRCAPCKREVILEGKRRYRERHPERVKAQQAARYAADKPRRKKLMAKWYRKNRKRRIAKAAEWQREHAAQHYKQTQDWRKRNPVKVAGYQSHAFARRRGAPGSHTEAEWMSLCARVGWRCVYCGRARKLTRDHAIPVSRKGSDQIENIRPACHSCNCRKNDRTEKEFRHLLTTGHE